MGQEVSTGIYARIRVSLESVNELAELMLASQPSRQRFESILTATESSIERFFEQLLEGEIDTIYHKYNQAAEITSDIQHLRNIVSEIRSRLERTWDNKLLIAVYRLGRFTERLIVRDYERFVPGGRNQLESNRKTTEERKHSKERRRVRQACFRKLYEQVTKDRPDLTSHTKRCDEVANRLRSAHRAGHPIFNEYLEPVGGKRVSQVLAKKYLE